MRNWIACYAAALTIILEQLSAAPRSSVTETPTPLVRIREEKTPDSGWHPDELLTRGSGRKYVLVWSDHSLESAATMDGQFLRN